MKKILTALLVTLMLLVTAPIASAHGNDCGHYETRYRIEQVYVPPRIIGYETQLIKINGQYVAQPTNPIWSEGYWATRYVPYTVWISVPCPQPYPRSRYYGPRVRIGFGFHF